MPEGRSAIPREESLWARLWIKERARRRLRGQGHRSRNQVRNPDGERRLLFNATPLTITLVAASWAAPVWASVCTTESVRPSRHRVLQTKESSLYTIRRNPTCAVKGRRPQWSRGSRLARFIVASVSMDDACRVRGGGRGGLAGPGPPDLAWATARPAATRVAAGTRRYGSSVPVGVLRAAARAGQNPKGHPICCSGSASETQKSQIEILTQKQHCDTKTLVISNLM